MKFEIHAGGMVFQHFAEPGQILPGQQALEAFMPLATTPMILPEHGQDDIADGEFRLRHVARDEISLLRRKRAALQAFLGKEQTGAAVHEEAGGLG